MSITGIVEGGVFCEDLGDIVINAVSGGIDIRLTVIDAEGSEVSQFSEKYFPDAKGVVRVTGLAELMEAYVNEITLQNMSYHPNGTLAVVKNYATLRIEVIQNGNVFETKEQKVYAANSRTSVFPADYPYFLSRFRERTVYEDQKLTVSFLSKGQTLKVGIAHMLASGQSAYRTIGVTMLSASEGMPLCYVCDPSFLAGKCGISVTDILYVEFKLMRDDTVIDFMKCIVDHGNVREKTTFFLKNLFGMPEYLVMTGCCKHTSELEGTFSYIGRKYRKVHTDLTTSYTICSGWIDDATLETVKDAIKSTEVYLMDGIARSEMVTITDIDLDYTMPRTTPLAAYLTYRVSEKVQEKFQRVAAREKDIFDDTFDETFE